MTVASGETSADLPVLGESVRRARPAVGRAAGPTSGAGRTPFVAAAAFLVVESAVPTGARSGTTLAAENGPFTQTASIGSALKLSESGPMVLELVLVLPAVAGGAPLGGAKGPVAGGAAEGGGET